MIFNHNVEIHFSVIFLYYYVPQTKFGRHIVFAPFLIIILIMAPKRSLWDILLLLCFLLLLHHPDCCRVMYCYYIIILILIILLPHIFVRSISRRCLDQTLWNLVGISYAMWSCAFKGWFFSKWLPLPWKRPKC